MTYSNGVRKPSEQLDDLLSGKVRWDASPHAIQSWAVKWAYDKAAAIYDLAGLETRRAILEKLPPDVKSRVEAAMMEIYRLKTLKK